MTLPKGTQLREHRFVRGLTAEQIDTLAAHATAVTFEENAVVLVDGRRSAAFYFLVSGSAAIELRATRYAVCVQALGPGDVFGWSALLDHQDTLFAVRARERVVAEPELRRAARASTFPQLQAFPTQVAAEAAAQVTRHTSTAAERAVPESSSSPGANSL